MLVVLLFARVYGGGRNVETGWTETLCAVKTNGMGIKGELIFEPEALPGGG